MRPERIAAMVVAARKQGHSTVTIGKHTFDLTTGGMCSRFARQVTEEALGKDDFGLPMLFACCAAKTEILLRREARLATEGGPGDVVCFNNPPAGGTCAVCGRIVGHIGIYLGGGKVAENTSSGKRGDPRKPGTKISTLAEIGLSRVSGYYRVVPTVPSEGTSVPSPGTPLVVLLPGSSVIPCHARVESDVTRCDLRPLAEAFGYEVVADHIEDQGKIYLTPYHPR